MNRNVKLWPTISSISTKRAIKEKDTAYKRFCNNLQWVHSKSKDCKSKNYNPWDQENQNAMSGQSNLAQVTYALSEEILTFDMQEEFEDTKEVVRIQKSKKRQTNNCKMTNNDQHKWSPKSSL